MTTILTCEAILNIEPLEDVDNQMPALDLRLRRITKLKPETILTRADRRYRFIVEEIES